MMPLELLTENNELCILSFLTSERISEMEDNFEEKDPHKYIELTQLNAKLNSFVWMMDRKGTKENVNTGGKNENKSSGRKHL